LDREDRNARKETDRMSDFSNPSSAVRVYGAAEEPLPRALRPSLADEIRRRMRHGDSIDDVDSEIIERSDLNGDQKAALWLYAWSFIPRRKQRASAELHMRLVGLGA
jgi:hypothetical protein